MQGWHDQHIGRTGQTTERIKFHQLRVQSDISGHLTIELEINLALFQNLDRFAHMF